MGLLFLAPSSAWPWAGPAKRRPASTDLGINDDFIEQLGNRLEPGGAALIALGRSDAPNKLLECLGPDGGAVIQVSLDSRSARPARWRPVYGDVMASRVVFGEDSRS